MGVGTDTMMPPKFGFVKTEGEFKPTSELQIHGTFPLEKMLKKDPGMNAEELNRFQTQKNVETSSQSISSPFLVTWTGLSNHPDQSLFLSPFLVQKLPNRRLSKICQHIQQWMIWKKSLYHPTFIPYERQMMNH